MRAIRLVAVDDDPDALRILRTLLPENIALETYSSAHSCLDAVKTFAPDIAILDLRLPDLDGLTLLGGLRRLHPAMEALLLSAEYSTEAAVAAIKAGASDYLTKPVDGARFREALGRSIAAIRSRREAEMAELDLRTRYSFEGMVGRSGSMGNVFDLVRRIGPHFRTALVTGPSGTGKELVARALHAHSGRGGPLVVCNCAAIPDSLVESELFGRVKGAFTGAVGESPGYFGQAAGGTLLLDEFGDLPLTAQAALLRAVQFGEVQRVGAARPVHVDLRIVACTNRDLRAAVNSGLFREDLFFRLSTFELALPALARRREDIPLLVRHFLRHWTNELNKDLRGITPAAEELLLRHSWPGNVRELEQAIHYGVVLTGSQWIDVADLPGHLQAPETATRQAESDDRCSLDEVRNRHVLRVIESADGDKRRAARILGVSLATLYRLVKQAKGAGTPSGLRREGQQPKSRWR
jgi:DNA-binding NtrC family response regulator